MIDRMKVEQILRRYGFKHFSYCDLFIENIYKNKDFFVSFTQKKRKTQLKSLAIRKRNTTSYTIIDIKNEPIKTLENYLNTLKNDEVDYTPKDIEDMDRRDFRRLMIDNLEEGDKVEFLTPMGSGETIFKFKEFEQKSCIFTNDVENRYLSFSTLIDNTRFKKVS